MSLDEPVLVPSYLTAGIKFRSRTHESAITEGEVGVEMRGCDFLQSPAGG